MKISVFGMGYVGAVTAACLARDGHEVVGVDVAIEKVDFINDGKSPIIEESIGEIIASSVEAGRLRATADAAEAVSESDLCFLCVGTPSKEDGAHDLSYVRQVSREIGSALVEKDGFMDVVLRSTVPPGTARSVVIPILEESSGRRIGDDFEVIFHPEFLREGSSVKDFYDPPKIVAGERVPGTADRLMELYGGLSAPRFQTTLEVAEVIKLVDNAFHATKITFANEVGLLCAEFGVDSREVMALIQADRKLNISPAYLRPGFAFGGSCLPKDLRSALSLARQNNLKMPMFEGVLGSNRFQVDRLLNRILEKGRVKVGMIGLAFKSGTDDLRESPLVELTERLLGKGYEIMVFDPLVQEASLVGQNRVFMEKHLPHITRLLANSMDDMLKQDLIIIGHPIDQEEIDRWLDDGKEVIDLVGGYRGSGKSGYTGLYW